MRLYYTDFKQILGAKLEQIRVAHINYCFYFPSEHCKVVTKYKSQEKSWDFPGGPVVNTPYYQCIGHRFNLWWGQCHTARPRKKEPGGTLKDFVVPAYFMYEETWFRGGPTHDLSAELRQLPQATHSFW